MAATRLPINIFSIAGMIMVEGFLWSPLLFLLIASLSNANPEFEEAARMSGAGVWRTICAFRSGSRCRRWLAVALLILVHSIEASRCRR